ncbi:hypothetical protein MMC18_004958 [Xylographa bjoerkii]|nr:hypothetical protein [Xylographa bjoerkii]
MELARRYLNITFLAIHPGCVATNLLIPFLEAHRYLTMMAAPVWNLPATPASADAWNQTWAAITPVAGKALTKAERSREHNVAEVINGAYCTSVAKEGGQTRSAKDPELATKLYEWTEEQLRQKGYIVTVD